MVTAMPCSRCNGMGSRIESPCVDCRGEGRRNETTTLTSRCPRVWRTARRCAWPIAGLRDCAAAQRSTLRAPASPARRRFERHGDDLHHEAHIAFTQAVLGADDRGADASRDTSPSTSRAGSANGTVHRLRHEGVEHLHGRGRGDLFVHLVVDVPTELDATSEDLLRQLATTATSGRRSERGTVPSRRNAKK